MNALRDNGYPRTCLHPPKRRVTTSDMQWKTTTVLPYSLSESLKRVLSPLESEFALDQQELCSSCYPGLRILYLIYRNVEWFIRYHVVPALQRMLARLVVDLSRGWMSTNGLLDRLTSVHQPWQNMRGQTIILWIDRDIQPQRFVNKTS